MERPYVVELSNDQLITAHVREPHPFRHGSTACYEMAVLVHRLKNAGLDSVARDLDLIESVLRTSMTSKLQGPMTCPKCMAKMLLFAAVIARKTFRPRYRTFMATARLLASQQNPLRPFTFEQLEAEIADYITWVAGQPRAIGLML